MPLDDCIKFVRGVVGIESGDALTATPLLFSSSLKEPEGMSLTDIAQKVGIGLATASRYIASLGKQNRHREEGLLLVESFEDPMERRKKIIRLTSKGRAVINKLVGELNANLPKR